MENQDISRPCLFVQTQRDFVDLVEMLRAQKCFALDTESNSFHAYREQVCLMQLSTWDQDYAVDPFVVDVRPLGQLLEDPEIEIVIHAADYDIRCLQRDYNFRMTRLFDTMLAAKLLGRVELSLVALVRDYFGVGLLKSFQRSDWGRRPLSDDQLEYAYTDTRYLLPLKEKLFREIVQEGLEVEANTVFKKQAGCKFRPKLFDVHGYRKLKGFRNLHPQEKEIVKALYLLREDCARSSNLPPFKVFSNEAMIELAKNRPVSCGELKRIKGIGNVIIHRYGDSISSTVSRVLGNFRAAKENVSDILTNRN